MQVNKAALPTGAQSLVGKPVARAPTGADVAAEIGHTGEEQQSASHTKAFDLLDTHSDATQPDVPAVPHEGGDPSKVAIAIRLFQSRMSEFGMASAEGQQADAIAEPAAPQASEETDDPNAPDDGENPPGPVIANLVADALDKLPVGMRGLQPEHASAQPAMIVLPPQAAAPAVAVAQTKLLAVMQGAQPNVLRPASGLIEQLRNLQPLSEEAGANIDDLSLASNTKGKAVAGQARDVKESAVVSALKPAQAAAAPSGTASNATATVSIGDPVDVARHGLPDDGHRMPVDGSEGENADQAVASMISETDVKVIRVETHLGPAARPGPIAQIGDAAVDTARATQEAIANGDIPKSDPIIKVLELQLEPNELGRINVRMSLSEGRVTLSLGVEGNDIAGLIERDREALSKHLQSSGLVLEGVDVKIVRVEPPAAQRQQTSDYNQQSAGFGQPMMSHDGAHRGQSGSLRRDDQDDERTPVGAVERDAGTRQTPVAATGLYL